MEFKNMFTVVQKKKIVNYADKESSLWQNYG